MLFKKQKFKGKRSEEGKKQGIDINIYWKNSFLLTTASLLFFWLPFLGFMMHEAMNNLENFSKCFRIGAATIRPIFPIPSPSSFPEEFLHLFKYVVL